MIEVIACRPQDFAGILAVQLAAHRDVVDAETKAREGFVSWRHDRATLEAFNEPVPHTVAIDETGRVVGFALSMDPKHAALMPESRDFVGSVAKLLWNGRPVGDYKFVCMGQIAIAAEHRGKGLFRRLYEAWFKVQAQYYELGITEIAAANTRSRNAHEALGWTAFATHWDGDQEWIVVGKDLG